MAHSKWRAAAQRGEKERIQGGEARDIEKSKVTEKDGKEAASSNDCILASRKRMNWKHQNPRQPRKEEKKTRTLWYTYTHMHFVVSYLAYLYFAHIFTRQLY